ncbi:sulfur carrier protein ThiS [candidate division TA06 bacterium]|nr:sulfur carrier protein ThiS [candidate division TA06 bacterium]
MKIKLNGKEAEAGSLPGLLERYGLKGRALVVEHNGIIIKSGCYDDVRLSDGDVLEIVRLVGGG